MVFEKVSKERFIEDITKEFPHVSMDVDEIYDKITLIIHQVYPGWVKTYENVYSVKLRELNSNLI